MDTYKKSILPTAEAMKIRPGVTQHDRLPYRYRPRQTPMAAVSVAANEKPAKPTPGFEL